MAQTFQPTALSLAGIRLFQELGEQERAAIAERCRGRTYEADEVVISANDPDSDVYFVVSGRVRVQLFSSNGINVIYRDIEPGGALGDLAAIDGKPRSATIHALAESMLAQMSGEDFWWTLASFPTVRDATLRRLSGLVRSLSETMFRIITMDVRQRILAEVQRLARTHMAGTNEAVVRPFPRHHEFASRIGTHREAVTRTLSSLTKEGLIARRDGAMVILDVAGVELKLQESLGL